MRITKAALRQQLTIAQSERDAALTALAECELRCPPTPPPSGLVKGAALPGDAQNWNEAYRGRVLDAMAANGATWARVNLNWGYPQPGQKVVAEIRARGMQALGVLIRPNGVGTMTPIEMSVFARQMAHSADAFEVWNEQNLPSTFPPPDPKLYAGIYNAAKYTLKSERPDVPVLVGGLSPADNKDGKIEPARFLDEAFDAGIEPDVLAWHPYCDPALPGEYEYDWSTWTKMTRHWTWGEYPIWLTEYGCPTVGPGEGFQAESIAAACAEWRKIGQGAPIFFYEPIDGAHPLDYGLLREDFSARPALDEMRNG